MDSTFEVDKQGLPPWRLIAAMAVACVSDAISLFTGGNPVLEPVQFGVDLATGLAVFMLLGWHWLLLPAIIAEAIPEISVLPFWIPVVVSIILWGDVRKP